LNDTGCKLKKESIGWFFFALVGVSKK